MNTGTEAVQRGRPFYGWRMALAGFVIVAVGLGAQSYFEGQLLGIVRDEFGGNSVAFGSVNFVLGAAAVVGLLAAGFLVDRFGPRALMLIGIPVASVGFLGLGVVDSLVSLNVFGALIGIGLSAGFLLPVQTATARWFVKRRCIALAIVSAAAVLGGPLIAPAARSVADQFAWRGAFLALGLATLVIGISLALLVRDRPGDRGHSPDGETPLAGEGGETIAAPGGRVAEADFAWREALRTRAFWLLSVALGLGSGLAVTIKSYTTQHFIANQVFTIETISRLSELTSLLGLAGILIFGYLGDRFSKRHLLALAIALQSASALILLTAGNAVQVYVYMLVFGLGAGIIPLALAIRADYFGRRAFATITVALTLISGAIAGPVFSLLSLLGSQTYYADGQLTYVVFVALGSIPAALFLLAKPPALKETSKP